MIYSYIIPNWFARFDILIQFLFGLIAVAVAAFSYRIYKITKEKNIQQFSVGFLFIAISYMIWGLINLLLLTNSKTSIDFRLEHLQLAGLLGVYAHMAFFIIGLLTIFYSNFRSNKREGFYLLLGLGLLSVFTYINEIAAYHLTAVFILFFINYHYLKEYFLYKNPKTLPVLIAFFLIFLGHLVFIFPVTYSEYVVAHILELFAYSLILVSLVRTVKIKPKRKIP